jgi:hypothetical protein
MKDDVKLIFGKEYHEKILGQFFLQGKSFIQSSQGDVEVRYIGFHDDLAEFAFPLRTSRPGNCSIFTRVKNITITVNLTYSKCKGDTVFCFTPKNFEIHTAPRNDERRFFNGDADNIIFATNIISDPGIKKKLKNEKDKLEKIKERVGPDGTDSYDYFNIVFADSPFNDPRMKYFKEFRSPIHIINFRKSKLAEKDYLLKYYLDNIFSMDRSIKENDEIVSEISVPVLCNNKIPYGYIQVNSRSPLSGASMRSLKRMAMLIDSMRIESKISFNVDHRFLVSDISENGLGIAFKNWNLLPYYDRKKMVSMDMIFPRRKKASIVADVRHIDILANKIIKVGFLIREMDNLSKIHFQRALDSRMVA